MAPIQNGGITMAGNPRRNPVTDEQIIAHYRESHSAYKTAEALGIGSTTVHRVLTKYNEPRPGLEEYRRNATMFRGQEQEICDAYEAGATYDQLREKFGQASDYALQHAIKRVGGKLRQNTSYRLRPGELEKVREMAAAGLSQVKISLALDRSQSFVSHAMKTHGIGTQKARGALHGKWNGGRWTDSSGYVRVWLDPNDPLFSSMAHSAGYILEHRLVMARKLGRALLPTETVHHIDGNRQNNDPINIELRQGKHGKHTAMVCLDCGSHNVGHRKLS
jgi:transposase